MPTSTEPPRSRRDATPLALLLTALWLAGCVYDSSALLECGSDADCPKGAHCDLVLGVCATESEPLPGDAEDAPAPDAAQPDTTLSPATCGAAPLDCGSTRACCTLGGPAGDCSQGGEGCACRDVASDPDNCGGCGQACPAGQNCVQGECTCPVGALDCADGCVDILSNAAHCGACARACGEQESCTGGSCLCDEILCEAGRDCCALPVEDGGGLACVDLDESPDFCGDCNNACGQGESCSGGDCACGGTIASDGQACPVGEVCCNGACVPSGSALCACGASAEACGPNELCCDGACVDVRSDPTHCGRCNAACPDNLGCFQGACGCAPPLPNVCDTGCADLARDPLNCGTCGNDCEGGDCCFGTCQDVASDPTNCGTCGTVCAAPADACCAGGCVDLDADLEHCGACGEACAAPADACCGAACVDTSTAVTDCGACGNDCQARPGIAAASCSAGACQLVCADGFADCDANPDNGCEPTTGQSATCAARSCRVILEQGHSSGSGAYWIDPDGFGAVEVYCDMDFAGGGWTLFGRIDQPTMWNVPSSATLVHPTQGAQHFSSRVGRMSIEEVRVIIATTPDPATDVKGHWSYVWNTPRALQDIYTRSHNRSALVPDTLIDHRRSDALIDNIVVVRTDDVGYNNSSHFVPTCWTTDCPGGAGAAAFADNDGSFSIDYDGYAGQDYTSNAFIGCDDGDCCLCWGSGDDSYCDDGCSTQNGGSESSTGHGWFYAR